MHQRGEAHGGLHKNLKARSTGKSAVAPPLRGLMGAGCSPWTLTMGLRCWLGPVRRGKDRRGPRHRFGPQRQKKWKETPPTFGIRLDPNHALD